MKHDVYLGLGTNLGNKLKNIEKAIDALSNKLGHCIKVSSLYQSKPWGFESNNDFINLVVHFKTNNSPQETLWIIKEIETSLGRLPKKGTAYESRPIDIDILLFDDISLNKGDLVVPHKHIGERLFVLEPLLEINSNKKVVSKYNKYLIEMRMKETLKKVDKPELL